MSIGEHLMLVEQNKAKLKTKTRLLLHYPTKMCIKFTFNLHLFGIDYVWCCILVFWCWSHVKNRNKIIRKLKILNGNIEVFSTASSLYTYRSVFSLLYFLYQFFASFHYCFSIVIVLPNISIVGRMISTHLGSNI